MLVAGSSKTAPRILIFSIILGAEYLSYVKSITSFALTFFGCIISVLASVLKTPQLRSHCFPVVKVLKTTTQAPMSNLRAHLKKIHADLMCQFDEKMKTSHKTRLL